MTWNEPETLPRWLVLEEYEELDPGWASLKRLIPDDTSEAVTLELFPTMPLSSSSLSLRLLGLLATASQSESKDLGKENTSKVLWKSTLMSNTYSSWIGGKFWPVAESASSSRSSWPDCPGLGDELLEAILVECLKCWHPHYFLDIIAVKFVLSSWTGPFTLDTQLTHFAVFSRFPWGWGTIFTFHQLLLVSGINVQALAANFV